MIYTKNSLVDKLELSGYEAFWFERGKSNDNHFVIDIISNTPSFADNKVNLSNHIIQISFMSQKPFDRLKIEKFMLENFNSTVSYEYDDTNEWYITIYDVTLILDTESF